jgi:hypothetical protein
MKTHKLGVRFFISESIDVEFHHPPTYLKKPPCPDGLTWRNQTFTIKKCIAEWKDCAWRGKSAANMQPEHTKIAEVRGSWGVGKFYFDVQTDCGRYFRLYYDRAPKDAHNRAGQWVLLAELVEPV